MGCSGSRDHGYWTTSSLNEGTSQRAAEDKTTTKLHSFELLQAMDPKIANIIVHSMRVHAPINAFVQHLPEALRLTFNTHPRMRAILDKDNATAHIQPDLTPRDVVKHNLLRVKEVSEEGMQEWESFAEECLNIAIDRYTELPFYFVVWTCQSTNESRIMLFSEHYMSDGMSGYIILNDLLEHISNLHQTGASPVKKIKLEESAYEKFLNDRSTKLRVHEVLDEMDKKKAEQEKADTISSDTSASSDDGSGESAEAVGIYKRPNFLFSEGTEANKDASIAKCRQEGTTIGAALLAAMCVAGYAEATSLREPEHESKDGLFRMKQDIAYNLRKRTPQSMDQQSVGCYFCPDVSTYLPNGIDAKSTSFWGLAKSLRAVLRDVAGGISLPTTMEVVERIMQSEEKNFGTILSGADTEVDAFGKISNLGQYPYEKEFPLGDDKLLIESIHFATTGAGPMTEPILFLSAVHKFDYGLMHKYEHARGSNLMRMIVDTMENLDQIDDKMTVSELSERAMTAVSA